MTTRNANAASDAALTITLTGDQAATLYEHVHPYELDIHESWRDHLAEALAEHGGDQKVALWVRDDMELLDQLERQRKQDSATLTASERAWNRYARFLLDGSAYEDAVALRAEREAEIRRFVVGLSVLDQLEDLEALR